MKKQTKKTKTRRKNWKKGLFMGAGFFLAIVLLVCACGLAVIFHYIGKIDIDTNPDTTINSGLLEELESEIDTELFGSEIHEIHQGMDEVTDREIMRSDDVINILLIGTDGRTVSERGRSDSMMIVSLNKKSKKIYITSIMRDSYVTIAGTGKKNRINAAYAAGGASLLMDTIEHNFRIEIDKYVSINFQSFERVVDYFGGIRLKVSNAEAGEITGLSSGGTYTLNGAQALDYARIRYVGNGDFERTERQREVLNLLIDKCRGMSVAELGDVMDFVLPYVKTNMSEGEIFGHIMSAPTYLSYDIVSQRVPCDGSWKNYETSAGAAVLSVDLVENVDYLESTVYDGVY